MAKGPEVAGWEGTVPGAETQADDIVAAARTNAAEGVLLLRRRRRSFQVGRKLANTVHFTRRGLEIWAFTS